MSIADKLTTIAENMQGVYDKGYSDGQSQGSNTEEAYNEGFEAGKKSKYDEFWDNYQDNGLKEHYSYAFAQWNKNTFQPKYDIKPTMASYMFYGFNQNRSVESLPELLKNNNVNMDFSKCTGFMYFGSYSYISDFGFIDCSGTTNLNHMFNMAKQLETVSLKLKDDGSQSFNNTFDACTRLADITIEGVIGKNISFSACASLSKSSIISIINALHITTSGVTVIFKKTAINNAFGIDIDDESTYPEGSEYYNLRNSKSNWTFNYV